LTMDGHDLVFMLPENDCTMVLKECLLFPYLFRFCVLDVVEGVKAKTSYSRLSHQFCFSSFPRTIASEQRKIPTLRYTAHNSNNKVQTKAMSRFLHSLTPLPNHYSTPATLAPGSFEAQHHPHLVPLLQLPPCPSLLPNKNIHASKPHSLPLKHLLESATQF